MRRQCLTISEVILLDILLRVDIMAVAKCTLTLLELAAKSKLHGGVAILPRVGKLAAKHEKISLFILFSLMN